MGLLEKGLAVLELLAQSEEPMGPTEIAKILDLNKSTIYRILKILNNYGYTTQNSSGKYSCGAKIVELASYFINNLELQTVAKPFLESLHAQLNMSVHIGVLEGTDTVYIEKLERKQTGSHYTHVGYKSPAHCSSIGKCLLSSMSFMELDEILQNWTFTKYTKNTITEPDKFKKHLKKVRQQGWSMDKEEYIIGHCCVGAPIYDYRGDVVACISVSGHSHEFSEEILPMIIEKVQETAELISRKMGFE